MSYRKKEGKVVVSAFSCKRGRFRICGTIYRTDKMTGGLTPVIICHGFMGNQREGRPEAIALACAGYVAFTFDFVGGTTFGKSGGTPLDMTIFTEKEDLRAVMDYVKTLDYVDYSKLVIGGCSQGGFVAGLVAADYPEEVKRLLLFYPALCIPDDARKGRNGIFQFDPDNVPDIIKAHGKKLNGDYARLVMDLDAIDAISDYPGSVFLACGKKDPVVAYDYMERLIAAFRQKRNTGKIPDAAILFFPVQTAGHGFSKREHQMVARCVVAFMKGYNEVLSIHVNITDTKLENHGIYNTSYVSFEAVCSNDYFKGKALPGAMDIQRRKLAKIIEFKADYVMRGTDFAGEKCDIHIVNRDIGNGWVPTVETNSRVLGFLNKCRCITIAESYKGGLIIHILAKPQS